MADTSASAPPEIPSAPMGARSSLIALSTLAIFLSVFFAAHGILMTVQILTAEIPPGEIESLERIKVGFRVHLDGNREAIFQSYNESSRGLKVGDRVEKRAGSPQYWINGKAVTDWDWLLEDWLWPTRLKLALGVYGVLGCAYALAYRRTPLADLMRKKMAEPLPPTPRNFRNAIVFLLVGWLTAVLVAAAVMSIMSGCLMGLMRGLRGD